MTGTAFISYRKAKYYFLQNIINDTRIIFLFLFIFIGSLGIFASYGIAFLLTIIVTFIILIKKLHIHLRFLINKSYLKETLKFSSGNYIATLLLVSPTFLFPIIVFNVLGSTYAAEYYIAFMITSVLNVIPGSISTSLLVEGSHGEPLKKNISRALFVTFSIISLAVVFFYVFGEFLLRLIGNQYVESYPLLRIMVISSFFYAICSLFISIKRIEKNIKALLELSFIIFILQIGLGYVLLIEFGIIGIGIALVIGYGLCSIFAMIFIFKDYYKNERIKKTLY
jgi:O-antigen/teichoic acid export membrane protein